MSASPSKASIKLIPEDGSIEKTVIASRISARLNPDTSIVERGRLLTTFMYLSRFGTGGRLSNSESLMLVVMICEMFKNILSDWMAMSKFRILPKFMMSSFNLSYRSKSNASFKNEEKTSSY
jgi:hypothetical protein